MHVNPNLPIYNPSPPPATLPPSPGNHVCFLHLCVVFLNCWLGRQYKQWRNVCRPGFKVWVILAGCGTFEQTAHSLWVLAFSFVKKGADLLRQWHMETWVSGESGTLGEGMGTPCAFLHTSFCASLLSGYYQVHPLPRKNQGGSWT